MTQCYTNPIISFNLFSKQINSTLFEENIIARNKEIKIDCNIRKMTFIDEKLLIITKNATNEIIQIENSYQTIGIIEKAKDEIDFKHSDLLIKSFDPIQQIEN